MSDFRGKLAALVYVETDGRTVQTGLDPDKAAEVSEGLAAVLAAFAAVQCGGDQAFMSEFLDSTVQYIYEEAAAKQKMAIVISNMLKQ
jgi:hypothetical protein